LGGISISSIKSRQNRTLNGCLPADRDRIGSGRPAFSHQRALETGARHRPRRERHPSHSPRRRLEEIGGRNDALDQERVEPTNLHLARSAMDLSKNLVQPSEDEGLIFRSGGERFCCHCPAVWLGHGCVEVGDEPLDLVAQIFLGSVCRDEGVSAPGSRARSRFD
jgi:hypothetical protein